ncbi:NAC domain-containing protein 19-like [Mangifera indica]|uniref:NAC domain-containing protein 19-like n=1 Tax=Mangifera indica TaxID=29780 RepID=UPI001CFB8960|nr:NAC domain-containing protein 19-like [Mangifera indica]
MVPTGFRFNPTDEEVIQILETKASGHQMPLHFNFIVERNVYEHEPQLLQWEHSLVVGENEKYCFCTKKNESRGVGGRGWWKATSHVKKIYDKNMNLKGYKRPLTFFRFIDNERRRDKAVKTNWIMHEYNLHSYTTEWRLCKIKYKGKPSVQEELENIRNVYIGNEFEGGHGSSSSTMNSQPNSVSDHQPNSVGDHQQQQPQASFHEQLDKVYELILSENFYSNPQHLENQDGDVSDEFIFTSLWSWRT